jgi:hypothetical protein
VHENRSQGLNGLSAHPGEVSAAFSTGRFAAAAEGRLLPAALLDGDPPVPFRRTVWVDFARRDLSGKISHPAGPQGRIQSGVGGDAGNYRLAHKARPARVRRRICGERHRRLGLSPSYDQDLKDIGVLLGHRRKILAAVAELPGKSPSASRPFPPLVEARDRHTTEPPQPAPVAPPPTEAFGERRHVTVMFCDLVDSTGIAAKLDAEEWRDLVGAYIDAASAAVVEMGGKVAKKLGDGLMALFGYPVAQENDAERAVRGRATPPPRDRSTVERVESLAPKPAVRVGCRSSRRDPEACADRGHGRARRQVGARLARISSCLGAANSDP